MNRTGGRRQAWRLAVAVASIAAVLLGLLIATPAAADAPLPQLWASALPTQTPGGVPSVGETVTLTSGTYSPTPSSYTYTWYRDSLPIDGATSPQYTLSTADEGQFITWTVTANLDGYQPYVYGDDVGTVRGADTLTPVTQLAAPQVTGRPTVGVPITVTTPGSFNPADAEVIYQWLDADGQHSQTSPTFTPSADDGGSQLQLRYWVTGFLYRPYIGVLQLGQVVPSALTSTHPTIQGSPVVGSTLSANGGWNATPDSIDYQWLSNGVPIPGATSATYQTQNADVGNTISVQLTGHLANLDPLTVTATSTFTVTVPYPNPPQPTISGSPLAGESLTAVPGDWGEPNTTFTYTWYWNGSQVGVGQTLPVFGSEAGGTISVVVTGSAPGYGPTRSAMSASTGVVQRQPNPVLSVSISPARFQGNQVKASVVLRAGDADAGLTYTWLLDGFPIGATGQYYSPAFTDVGRKLSVEVSAVDSYYDMTPVVSNSEVVAAGYMGGAVTIVGSVRVGSTVSIDTSTWQPVPTTVHYEWFITTSDGTYGYEVLSRAPTFTIPAWALGHQLYVFVQGFKSGFITPPDIWYNTDNIPIGPGQFTSRTAPAISGLPTVGSRLTATPGTASPSSGDTVHYQWYSAATAGGTLSVIAGATSSSYVPTAAMLHRFLVLRVVTGRPSFSNLVVYSAETAAVLSPASQRVAHPPAQSHAGAGVADD